MLAISTNELCHIKRNLTDFFFPPKCLVCSDDLRHLKGESLKDEFSSVICQRCLPKEKDLHVSCSYPHKGNICPLCGEINDVLLAENTHCLACSLFPIGAREVRSLFYFRNEVENVIKRLKYAHKRPLASYLAKIIFMNAFYQERLAFTKQDWDIIVTVPSSFHIMRGRGFNHLGLVASKLSKLIDIDVDYLALTSRKHRKAQAELSIEKRFKNIKNAFCASNKVSAKNVLMLDDVLTSGASIIEATSCLLAAGAKAIDIVTISRSEHFQTNRLKSYSWTNERTD